MKTKAHTIYKLQSGKRVPGVTTITEELGWSKRNLMKWAYECGCNGIDYNKFKDDKADIGTLAHAFITDHYARIKTDTSDYSQNQIDAALNAAVKYWEWEKQNKFDVDFVEKQLVSEAYQFGGTIDLYGKINGILTLVDLKSGSGIYDEHLVQVAGGYRTLLIEHNHPVVQVRILNIPRTEDENFKEVIVADPEHWWNIFYHALQIYKLRKEKK